MGGQVGILFDRMVNPIFEREIRGTFRGLKFLLALGTLLGANAFCAAAYAGGWLSLNELLWAYWLQSVFIGVFNFVRIRALKACTLGGWGGRTVSPKTQGLYSMSFLMGYSFFHLMYLGALLKFWFPSNESIPGLVVVGVGFAAGEWFSFRRHRELDDLSVPSLTPMMGLPYIRVLPMQLAFMAGRMFKGGAMIFLPLKIFADIMMFLVDECIDANRAGRAERARQRAAR